MRRGLIALAFVLLVASPASALEERLFTRSGTVPHAPSLAAALVGTIPGTLLIQARASDTGIVVSILANSWTGVNLTTVQAAVDAAPADTPALRAKTEKDKVRDLYLCVLRAIVLMTFDEVNTIRANIAASSLAPRTLSQLDTALDAKIDGLGCQ